MSQDMLQVTVINAAAVHHTDVCQVMNVNIWDNGYLDTRSLNTEDRALTEDKDERTLLDIRGESIPIQVNALK